MRISREVNIAKSHILKFLFKTLQIEQGSLGLYETLEMSNGGHLTKQLILTFLIKTLEVEEVGIFTALTITSF